MGHIANTVTQGPNSQLASPLPTTCFTDTILIPLPVWLYLVLIPLLFISTRSHRRRNFNPSTVHLRSVQRRSIFHIALNVLYYFLIVANILMETLEIVRLSLINFGIGLLPFSYVALILGLLLHATNGFGGRIDGRMWKGANIFVWIGSAAVSVVKTAGLVRMENNGVYRTDSKYPMSDQVIDVAVMAGVYLVIAGLEVWLGLWRRGVKGT
jgi:hypothetical protein